MNLNEIIPVFENESKKEKLIGKYKPGFSLRIDTNGQIQTVKASIEKINSNQIELSQEAKYFENNFFSENKSDISLKSKGLTDVNISFSKKICSFLNLDSKNSYGNSQSYQSNTKTIHCIHSIYVSFINVIIDEKDIKLKDIIKQKFKDCLKKKEENEKKKTLFELFDLYGMFVPLEFTLGGKYNIFFEAKDLKEKDEITNNLNNLTKLSLIQGNLDVKYDKNKSNEFNKEIKNSKYSISLEGGDISLKYDFDGWIKSLNLDNLEIIDFKTLVKIYDFLDDEIKEEVNNLIYQEKKLEIKEGFNEMIYCFEKPDINIKIMLLGDSFVGKTTLINRIASGTFLKFHQLTIALDFVPIYKKININNKDYLVKTILVDTGGTERYKSVSSSFIKQCDGFMLIYDISNKNGLNDIKEWKKLIDDNSFKTESIMLVGNKSDLEKKIDINEAKYLATNLKIMFGNESSCKNLNDINIEKNMFLLISKIAEEIIKKKESESKAKLTQFKKSEELNEINVTSKKGGCC